MRIAQTTHNKVLGRTDKRLLMFLLESRSKRALVLTILLLIALSSYKAYICYENALKVEDYISDEVWYVTSARTILQEVLGAKPEFYYNGMRVYTVFALSSEAINSVERYVLSHGGVIVKSNYKEERAVAVAIPFSPKALMSIEGVDKVLAGYPYPDKDNIQNYYNFEHPPLGKYVIGLAMLVAGSDVPVVWRLPSIIEASLIVFIVGLVGFYIMGVLGATISATAAAVDTILTSLGSAAMLDIHIAFFLALAMLAILRNRVLPAVVFASIATMVKFSGLFLLAGLYAIFRLRGRNPRELVIPFLAIPLLVGVLIYLPLILHFGLDRVLREIASAIAWHTTSRPAGPPSSTPLEWIVGVNAFYLHFNPDMPAKGSPFIYVPVFVVGLLLLSLALSRNTSRMIRESLPLDLVIIFFSFIAGFYLVYALGNRTLYSFYLVEFAPAAYALLPYSLYLIFLDERGVLYKSLEKWLEVFKSIVSGSWTLYKPPAELSWLWRVLLAPSWIRQAVLLVVSLSLLALSLHWLLFKSLGYAVMSRLFIADPAATVPPMGLAGIFRTFLGSFGFEESIVFVLDAAGLVLFANELRIMLESLRARGELKHRVLYVLPLSILVYGVFDGSGLSLFLFALALNMLESRRYFAGLLLALAANNVILMLAALVFLALRRMVLPLLGYITGFLLVNLPLQAHYDRPLDWWQQLSYMLTDKISIGVGSLVTGHVIGTLALLSILLVALLYANKFLERDLEAIMVAWLLCYSVLPNSMPQWLVFLAALSPFVPPKALGLIVLIDTVNALMLPAWIENSSIMTVLFKYQPQGPLDPYSAPMLLSILRTTCMLALVYRVMLRARARRR